MSLKVCLAGSSGKMGKEILKITEGSSRYQVVRLLLKDLKIESLSSESPDVLIDFTLPAFFSSCLEYAVQNKLPLVSGTTGLSEAQFNQMKEASKTIPILWSSNMSLGICVLKKMLHALKGIDDFEFYIEETHHKNKKDAPSGTALTIREHMEESVGLKVQDVFALRGGGVFGEHRVIALGEEETLVVQHNALNRTVFARGAIRCAEWLSQKENGFYSVEDVLFE